MANERHTNITYISWLLLILIKVSISADKVVIEHVNTSNTALEEINKFLLNNLITIKNPIFIKRLLDSNENIEINTIKIIKLGESLKELKLQFEKNDRNLAAIKTKVLTIAKDLKPLYESLMKSFHLKIIVSNDKTSYCLLEQAKIDNNNTIRELNLFINNLEVEQRKEQMKQLTQQCIKEMNKENNDKDNNFGKLRLISDKSNVNMFVTGEFKENYRPNSVEMLLKFSEQLEEVNEEFQFCKEIDSELKDYQENDGTKLVKLIKLFKNNIDNSKNYFINKDAARNLERYKSQLYLVLKDYLKNELFTCDMNSVAPKTSLPDLVFIEAPISISNVYKDFVEDMHKCRSIDLLTLIKYSCIRFYDSNKILFLKAIYDEMRSSEELDNSVLITYAFRIQEVLLLNKNYSEVNTNNKEILVQIKNELSRSIINLINLKEMCIQNKLTSKYLSIKTEINNGTSKKSIYLSNEHDGNGLRQWKLEQHPDIDNRFYILSVQGEYLSISDMNLFSSTDNRYLTTVPVEGKDYRGLWYIEQYKNSTRVKSYLLDEYLIVNKVTNTIVTSSNSNHLDAEQWDFVTCQ